MTTIADFFEDFYATAGPGAGVVELRCISHDRSHTTQQFFSDVPKLLEEQAHNWNMRARKSGVYFAVAMRKPDAVTGTKEDVSCVTALWVDIDVVKIGWDMGRTLAALKASPLRPSIIINSGNGYHCYWLLKEPAIVGNGWDIEHIEDTLKQLAALFSGDMQATDITRVLRVPYTHNRKGEKVLDVAIEVEDWGLEYDYEAIGDYALERDDAVLFNGEWLSKATIKEKMLSAKKEKQANALGWQMYREAGGNKETMSYAEVWRHTKYGGDINGAFIGLDEAILRATAILYARFGGQWSDETIVEDVVANVKRIKQRDAPHENWNWKQERREIQDKLERFKERWQAMRELENGKTKKRANRK